MRIILKVSSGHYICMLGGVSSSCLHTTWRCCVFAVQQRRALRTASEKLRSRTSFSATAVQHSPATRVNRYIGRLIEARQTESETSDLNYFTLFYRSRERERRVRPEAHCPDIRWDLWFYNRIPFHRNPSLLRTRQVASWWHPLPTPLPYLSCSHTTPYTVYNSTPPSPTPVVSCVCACLHEESTHPLRRGCR